ncbi:hypothetical protein [Streptomyces sp. NPDC050145]|uniref:hypothetical protein n=1 Tax=Streptomyces sp. NPDC050145 TaxID=3365602 RepID=UPI00379A1DE4
MPAFGPATLLAAPLALIAFRGCPTCWMVGLAQTITRGRLERNCVNGVCTLSKVDQKRTDRWPANTATGHAHRPTRTDPES